MTQMNEQDRRVTVAGATGYLGKHVVRALHRDGWKVRAVVRDRSRLGEAAPLCDEIVTAEVTRAETLTGCFDGAQAAFSSVGIRHFRRKPTYEAVDYRGNLNLVEAAEAAGVSRFVFVSVLGGADHRRISPLVDARERVVDRLKHSDMTSVILRPTGFFNDMGDYFAMAKRGKAWLIGSGDTKINPIHGGDLADVAARALADPDPEFEIPAGGPDVFTQREIAETAFRLLNKNPRFGSVSPGLIRAIAKLIFPFNKNAAALALMFSILGESDGTAPCYGTHRLAEYFRTLAQCR